MKFHILDLIIYGHENRKRVIQFKPGELNIITGSSSTGKSTILKIIDYLLGRSSFNIPSGPIRDKVLWYGIRVNIGDQQMFIAKPRPKPGALSQSSVYVEEGSQLELPVVMPSIPNSNDESLIKLISDRIGIEENTTVVSEVSTRDSYDVTSRHTIYYNFQDQGVIANPSVLFHRQSEEYQPQAIRDSLPYFLGVNNTDSLNAIIKLRSKRRELKLISKTILEKEALSFTNTELALRLAGEAINSGLMSAPIPGSAEELLPFLNTALHEEQSRAENSDREQEVRSKLLENRTIFHDVDNHLRTVREYVFESIGYLTESEEHRGRLQSIGLFKQNNYDPNISNCPLCSSEIKDPPPTVTAINESLLAIEKKLDGMQKGNPRVMKLVESLISKREETREKIRICEAELRSLMLTNERLNREELIMRTKGRISLFLETAQQSEGIPAMKVMQSTIKREIEKIEELISAESRDDKMFAAISEISQTMTELAESLELEYAGYIHRLDVNKLTVSADVKGSPIIMGTTLGGGANHLGCHILAMLSLHKYFINHQRPVPGFIIFDQPTQVYFPENSDDESPSNNEDRMAVVRLFNVINDFVKSCNGNLQVIIVDHARENVPVFNDHLADEPWRSGRALVPLDWPDALFN